MSHHQEPNCFTVETILRNLPQQESFVVERTFPIVTLRPDLDPEKLKGASGKGGGKELTPIKQPDLEREMLDLLPPEGLGSSAWEKLAKEKLSVSSWAARASIKALKENGSIMRSSSRKPWLKALCT